MIISFDIMNENDYKKTFIDPPISTVHSNLKYALTLKYHRIEKFLPKAVPCR